MNLILVLPTLPQVLLWLLLALVGVVDRSGSDEPRLCNCPLLGDPYLLLINVDELLAPGIGSTSLLLVCWYWWLSELTTEILTEEEGEKELGAGIASLVALLELGA